jgi:hypothetical protein
MKTLTQIHFVPPASGTLYFADGRFRSLTGLAFTDLPTDQQTAVDGAMQWLAGMAATLGFATISEVFLRRVADTQLPPVDPEDETEEPIYSPAFVAEITGSNAEGLRGVEQINSVPGPETNAMAELWDMFQSGLNPEEDLTE